MLKLDQLFIRNFVIVIIFILAASGVATYFWFKDIYLDQVRKNLSQNIDSVALSLQSMQDIDAYVDAFKEKTGIRITFIAISGRVLAESDKDKATMENHAYRDEILQLQNAAVGTSIRRSDTTHKDHLYVAKEVTIADKRLYLRMAEDIEKIYEQFVTLSTQILAIFFISLFLAVLLALRINKRLKEETDNVLNILHMLLDKKVFEVKNYGRLYEFNKITKLLNVVGSKLKHRQNLKTKQNAKLKLANRQKDEILSALSHEFKNPIAVITGYCETMLHNSSDEQIRQKFLQKIEKNAHKMSQIIDKLRLSLKLEDGKQSLQFEKTDIAKLAAELAADFQHSYKNRKVILTARESFHDIDKVLFTIALSNLIENALKYSKQDVTVTIDSDHISVIDKGLGLEEEEIKNLTRKFYRVSQNSWNNSLGLGLHIVDNIVKLHGFHLHISSKRGQGSDFRIYFNAKR
ncbi:MAG: ATP-binding protein [Campylobacterota bacterium]